MLSIEYDLLVAQLLLLTISDVESLQQPCLAEDLRFLNATPMFYLLPTAPHTVRNELLTDRIRCKRAMSTRKYTCERLIFLRFYRHVIKVNNVVRCL